MRFTKIVTTLGPAVASEAGITMLAKNGMNVARLNFSHGDHTTHGENIRMLKEIRKKGDYNFAILLDTKGPEIRTGDVTTPIKISEHQEVLFTPSPTGKEKLTEVKINYDLFSKDVKNARCILLDNGGIEFVVTQIKGKVVKAKAKNAGSIGSRRHVNLPGAYVSLPSFTKKDWDDIRFGIEQHVDFIAPSFVRDGKDIKELRAFLTKKKSEAKIITKIETEQAVNNIDDIIDLSDGIMIARGDLGVEIPFERIPRLQDEIILKCRQKGKLVITATHMLESMIENPMPTRAEVTDIAHATMALSDATMLSGETASGKFPKEAVRAMVRVIEETEEFHKSTLESQIELQAADAGTPRKEQALAACVLAKNLKAKAIVAITRGGNTARAVSRFRPSTPILAFTESETVRNQLALSWGVSSSLLDLEKDPEKTVQTALKLAKKKGDLKKGDLIIVLSDIFSSLSPETDGYVMTVQIRKAI